MLSARLSGKLVQHFVITTPLPRRIKPWLTGYTLNNEYNSICEIKMTKRRHSDDENETLQPQCKWHVGAREVDALNSEQMQVVYDKTRKLLVDGSKCQVVEQDPIRAANPLAYKCVTCTRESSICKCCFCNQYVCTVCVRFCSRCHYDFCHLCSTLRYGQKNEDAVCLTCY